MDAAGTRVWLITAALWTLQRTAWLIMAAWLRSQQSFGHRRLQWGI